MSVGLNCLHPPYQLDFHMSIEFFIINLNPIFLFEKLIGNATAGNSPSLYISTNDDVYIPITDDFAPPGSTNKSNKSVCNIFMIFFYFLITNLKPKIYIVL